MITICNLTKQYKKTDFKALDNVTLSIDKGIYGLLGNNGAGKTTLMNILTTLLPQSSGHIIINGIELISSNYGAIRKIIGYMPQENEMYGDMTAEEAIEYFSILNKIESRKRKEISHNLIEYVNLKKDSKKKFRNLSGGMKRRLGLALALINDPQIIIADEPTTGVDPYERIRMRELLMQLSQTKTVIVSTHIIEDISYMCQQLAVLNRGQVYFEGDMEAILNTAENKVWLCKTSEQKEIEYIKSKYMVLGLSREGTNSLIKIFAQSQPNIEAKCISPTLEDAYVILGKENANE